MTISNDFEKIGELVRGADRFALQYFVASGNLVSQLFRREESLSVAEMAMVRETMLGYVKECVVH